MAISRVSSLILNRLTLVLIPLFLCAQCGGRCFPTSTDPAERFPESTFVFRLQYDPSYTATLPCALRTYEASAAGGSSSIDDSGYGKYTILEIYKQDWQTFLAEDATTKDQTISESALATSLQVGDSIALVYWTDTGLRRDIPTSLTEDAGGFLAFLSPERYCHSVDDPMIFPLPEVTSENLLSNPFVLSACERANQAWSQLSPESTLFLEGLGAEESFLDVSRNATNSTSMAIDANETFMDSNSSELEIQVVEAEDANLPSGAVGGTSSARAPVLIKILLPLVLSMVGMLI